MDGPQHDRDEARLAELKETLRLFEERARHREGAHSEEDRAAAERDAADLLEVVRTIEPVS